MITYRVRIAHPGGPGIGWEYLRMPGLERHLAMVCVEPVGTGDSGRLAALVLYDTSPVADEQFWSAAVAAMERFVKDHVNDHPEVAGYVAALTTRLDRLDDEGTTAVLQTMMPAHLFDYWGREEEFAPARQSLRMYAAPTRGQGAPFDIRDELPGITTPALVLAGEQDFICGPRWARRRPRIS
ncbi:hypothetical protein [Streptomyces sp. NPDC004629]|uniref:alpha/beta fold hydrolase n=1 Tax=Streptomyces sp. NPDC004629 TaxID=3364705 RepID=UPI003692AA5F